MVVGRGVAPALRVGRSRVSAVTNRALEPKWARPLLYLIILGFAIWYPRTISNSAQQSLVNDVAIYALLGLGLNVVVGFAGLLDLGYIAFYAIGAYTTAYFTSKTAIPWHAPFVLNPFFLFPIAVIVAALAGVLLGGPTLRLRGDYLAIVTLGFGEIVYLLANNEKGITNGAAGAFGVPQLSIHIGSIKYHWGLASLPYYYLLLGIIVVVMMAFSALNYIEARSASEEEMRHLTAIVHEYLPTALNDFAALPAQYAERPGVTGTTPADDLLQQLILLDEGANDLQDLVYTGDAAQLAIQARFLDTKFRRSDLDS
jgi:hypothetical protein